jgi:ribosomal protein RSM22 (predicted rRNA methylase)
MQLPAPLRAAVNRALEGVSASELSQVAAALSQRYRAEIRDGTSHLADGPAALAYIGARMPATYAAVRRCFAAVAEACPGFAPSTALDAGAGPGTALWAAADCWPALADAVLIESSTAIRNLGEKLFAGGEPTRMSWHTADLTAGLPDLTPRDLVTLAYVLNELSSGARDKLIDRLWQLTAGVLVIVEPGTPAGWRRILSARARLLAAGAFMVAPCPHAHACPLAEPDWCHFAERVERTRLHRTLKQADVPWEDEKFTYVAAARQAAPLSGSRVIAPPRTATGRVMLKLCQPDGVANERLVTRREGAAFEAARRCNWGDVFSS